MKTSTVPTTPENEKVSPELLVASFRKETEDLAAGIVPENFQKCPSILMLSITCDCPATLALGFKGHICQRDKRCIVRETLFINGTFS